MVACPQRAEAQVLPSSWAASISTPGARSSASTSCFSGESDVSLTRVFPRGNLFIVLTYLHEDPDGWALLKAGFSSPELPQGFPIEGFLSGRRTFMRAHRASRAGEKSYTSLPHWWAAQG